MYHYFYEFIGLKCNVQINVELNAAILVKLLVVFINLFCFYIDEPVHFYC